MNTTIGNRLDLPRVDTGELLAKVGEYEVRQNKKFRWLQEGNSIQSLMEREQPSNLILPTHHAMFCAVACLRQATSVLSLGSGSASIERKLFKSFPHLSCVSVDASKQMVDLTKEYFLEPGEHKFIVQTAEDFLDWNTDKFDIVMVDLFAREAMAQCLYDPRFYEAIHSSINLHGIVALNLIPQDQNDLLNVLLPLRKYCPNVWLSEVDNHSNIVLLATIDMEFDVTKQIIGCVEDAQLFGFDLNLIAGKFTRLPMPQ